MSYSDELAADLFFINNGEIDLLTGAMAPARFNQIVERDLQLSDRNLTQLTMICSNLNINTFLEIRFKNNRLSNVQLKLEVESELVSINFQLKNTFRQSDCISRTYQLGFWVFLVGKDQSDGNQLLSRSRQKLPTYLDLNISHREPKQTQLDWYSQIDRLQLKN